MSMRGIAITARPVAPHVMTEEELERIYVSLEGNMALRSIDMFIDFDDNSVRFHFGIDLPTGLDSEDFLVDVANDALDKAFDEATDTEDSVTLSDTRVLAFA